MCRFSILTDDVTTVSDMGHGNCQQDTIRALNKGMISKYLEKNAHPSSF